MFTPEDKLETSSFLCTWFGPRRRQCTVVLWYNVSTFIAP